MIIGGQDASVQLTPFLQGLDAAAGAVVLLTLIVDGKPHPVSTGWLITESLVVVPDYAIGIDAMTSPPSKFLCNSSWRGTQVEVEAAWVPDLPDPQGAGRETRNLDGSRAALLRLRQALPGRAMRLGFGGAVAGQGVALLHHPEGQPELRLSIGRTSGIVRSWLQHDADTRPGSGGAPILAMQSLTLLGMQVRSGLEDGSGVSPGILINEGLTLAALLESLHGSPAWPEIAAHHGLADVQAARIGLERRAAASPVSASAPDHDLLPFALRWEFDPAPLSPALQDQLRGLVDDPSAARHVLSPAARHGLIKSAGSLAALQQARPAGGEGGPWQSVIDRIVAGPPFDLDEITEALLPHWLQAVRWFAGVVPGLPSPADVAMALERRRLRSRLTDIVGAKFSGRDREIAVLDAWYKDTAAGALAVTGIGGMGKSASVACFASSLPPETLLLWLDFDRADLAPDDALSVLVALAEQIAIQLAGFAPPELQESDWAAGVEAFGAALAKVLPAEARPLLVLDGFEVAQHAISHAEIWAVLRRLTTHVPRMRVVVSGRAPVTGLQALGGEPRSLPLVGLAAEEARKWLQARDITDDAVLDRIVAVSQGIPLLLKMAVRLVGVGGGADLLQDLPRVLVEGYLYRRILDRVIDQSLKPLARDALVLRSLTDAIVTEVLFDSVPASLSPAEVLPRLSRELALVEAPGSGQDPLRLRPEVRTATLRLLERDDAARVQEIDRRTAAWYAQQEPMTTPLAAELVYHRLRLGDVPGAEQAWRDGCDVLLRHAEDDLPETAQAARDWLRVRTTGALLDARAWEAEADTRIRAALARGLLRGVPPILGERRDRAEGSRLLLFDAWAMAHAGDRTGARALLAAAPALDGPGGRDRSVLAATLAARDADRGVADALLEGLDDEACWADRPVGTLEQLAVQAARIRLTVDLDAELELSDILQGQDKDDPLVHQLLWPGDVVMPSLSARMRPRRSLETVRPSVPSELGQLNAFRRDVERSRQRFYAGPLAKRLTLLDSPVSTGPSKRHYEILPSALQLGGRRGASLALRLAVLGCQRWKMATRSLFLSKAAALGDSARAAGGRLVRPVLGTLAAFQGHGLDYGRPDVFPVRRVKFGGEEAVRGSFNFATPNVKYLAHESGGRLVPKLATDTSTPVSVVLGPFAGDPEQAQRLMMFMSFVLDTPPLEALCNKLLGITDRPPAEAAS